MWSLAVHAWVSRVHSHTYTLLLYCYVLAMQHSEVAAAVALCVGLLCMSCWLGAVAGWPPLGACYERPIVANHVCACFCLPSAVHVHVAPPAHAPKELAVVPAVAAWAFVWRHHVLKTECVATVVAGTSHEGLALIKVAWLSGHSLCSLHGSCLADCRWLGSGSLLAVVNMQPLQ